MAKIIFEEDVDHSDSVRKKRGGRSFGLAAVVVLVSLVVGLIGGLGSIYLLSYDNGSLAEKLGIQNAIDVPITTTKTEKLVLEESNAIITASEKVSPSVVSIVSKQVYQDIFGRSYESSGAGTGFIITSDGLIITNKHVVADESTQYTVVLSDGRNFDAVVQSRDTYLDFAVIKIDAKDLPVVELGDSDEMQIGQWVVAIGNALGQFQNTVTVGVISAKNRQIDATDSSGRNSETLDNLLQTDAAINSGNSGGPLTNLKGQVIGINTAVASQAQGIGFAIPINSIKSALDSIKETGKIVRPYLGVRYVMITKDIAEQNDLSVDYGALIIRGNGLGQVAVVPGSPADKAGLVENDIILEVNGEKVGSNSGLVALVSKYKVGEEVTLKVLSKGGEKTVKVKLEEMK
ncbi:MAG: putative serine protease HtrA [bacterium ADurb.Bin212]|nr:MAG: putative serine protease HtrA [bacterium ADurb.Bin212]